MACPHISCLSATGVDKDLYALDRDQRKEHAERFLVALGDDGNLTRRVARAWQEIDDTGTCTYSLGERRAGAQEAWRTSPDCPGSHLWRELTVLDYADTRPSLTTTFRNCLNHLRWSTHGGRIRPAITLLPPDRPGKPGPRIWSDQVLRFADDPDQAARVAELRALGWEAPVDRFTVMPLVAQIPGAAPELFTIPDEDVLLVPITHPRHSWLGHLHLVWPYAPVITRMRLRLGGVDYPCAFSGWYMPHEPLEDLVRWDVLPILANRLDLPSHDALRLDKAAMVLYEAIWESYQDAGVTLDRPARADEKLARHLAHRRHNGETVHGDLTKLLPSTFTTSSTVRRMRLAPPDPDADPCSFIP